jgi:hypothetical protein
MIMVTMGKGKHTEPFPDRIITVTGKLQVEVEADHLGYITSVYRIRAESVHAVGPAHTHRLD